MATTQAGTTGTGATDVVMPSLTDGMQSGTVIAWLATDGATIAAGDELLEVETDKATATVAAEASGVLRILVEVGETVDVGRPIARLSAPGAGEPPEAGTPAARPSDAAPAGTAPSAALDDAPTDAPDDVSAEAPEPAPAAAPVVSPAADGVRASPVARRIAGQHGVELAAVTGSGPGGRIVRADVERAAGGAPAPTPPPPAPGSAAPQPPTPPAGGDVGRKGAVRVVELTRTQAVVARRMVQSKAEAPEFVLGVDVDMEAAVALRAQLAALVADDARPPSYNDIVIKACALALREYPRANGAYVDGRFELYEHVNVGVAVAADDALVVPTIFRADTKSLGEIGRESRRLAALVRDGKVAPADVSGGTFTVSNLGMFGISEFVAVLNPPQAAILAVGELKRTPVEHDGAVALRHVMRARLTCDHRILYGADAAGFLRRVKQLLEAPLAMAI